MLICTCLHDDQIAFGSTVVGTSKTGAHTRSSFAKQYFFLTGNIEVER